MEPELQQQLYLEPLRAQPRLWGAERLRVTALSMQRSPPKNNQELFVTRAEQLSDAAWVGLWSQSPSLLQGTGVEMFAKSKQVFWGFFFEFQY